MADGSLGWKGGQPWSRRFDDRYFSADSGIDEARHVFLHGNRLPGRMASLRDGQVFRIGETGFGTGLNFLCAWQLFDQVAPEGAALEFHSVEAYPLDADGLRAALALWPTLRKPAAALQALWPGAAPGRHRLPVDGIRVQLVLDIDDVAAALPSWAGQDIDAWFLDGFAPAKNPAMWSSAVLAAVARASRPGASLATYTSAGWVRRGLQHAGFRVRRAPGFGRKREMLVGHLGPSASFER
jgi:tRNA 5-methylaminomethyl-2-thiouridine biosynthesis bifunctional protein